MDGEDGQDLVEVWRSIITDVGRSWVLFEHGTCVILMQPEQDVESQAVQLLKEYGPVLVAAQRAISTSAIWKMLPAG